MAWFVCWAKRRKVRCRCVIAKAAKPVRLAGRGQRDLKRLLNECALPAFVRARVPLLYCDEQLLAVANVPQLSVAQPGSWQFVLAAAER